MTDTLIGTEISALATGTTLDGSEVIPADQAGVTVRITAQQIADLAGSGPVLGGTGAVDSVNGHVGAVTLSAADLNLSQVDNTSDATKNAAAVNLTNKTINGSLNTLLNVPQAAVTGLVSALGAVVNTAGTGLTLTGNTVALANTAVSAALYGSPSTVPQFTVDQQGRITGANAINIAVAQSAVTNLTTDLAAKAPGASPTFSGTVTFAAGTTNDVLMGYGTLAAESGTTAIGSTNLGPGVQMTGVQRRLGGLHINQRFTQSTRSGRVTAADSDWLVDATTITSASANFTQADVGKYLNGPDAYIKSVTNATTVVLESGAKHASDPFLVGLPAKLEIIDPIPGSPLNIQINHVIDGTNNWAVFGTQSGFGLNANQGPRGYINLEGTTEFTGGGWQGCPILFQSSNVYVNRKSETITGAGVGALFNVSTQFLANDAPITLTSGGTGRMFTDNFTFVLRGGSTAAINASDCKYSSFTTEFGLIGTNIYLGEYRQFWAERPNTLFNPKLTTQTGFYADTLIQATNNNQVSVFTTSVTIGAYATSSTSNTVGTGSKTFTVGTGLNFYGGQNVSAANGANSVTGIVDSYNSGDLIINVVTTAGSGTFTSWTINSNVAVTGIDGGTGSTLTLGYTGAIAPAFASWSPTISWAKTGSPFISSNVYDSQATYQNVSTAATIALGVVATFNSQNTYRANTRSDVTAYPINDFWAHPTFGGVSGGTLAAVAATGFAATATVNTGATLTTRYGFRVEDIGGTAASSATTTQYGLDIPALTGAATNVGIRNLSSTALGTTLTVGGNFGMNGKTAQALTGFAAPTATQARGVLADASSATTVLQTLAALIVDLRANGVIG